MDIGSERRVMRMMMARIVRYRSRMIGNTTSTQLHVRRVRVRVQVRMRMTA